MQNNEVADLLPRTHDGGQVDGRQALLADVCTVAGLHVRHLVTVPEPVVRLEDLQEFRVGRADARGGRGVPHRALVTAQHEAVQKPQYGDCDHAQPCCPLADPAPRTLVHYTHDPSFGDNLDLYYKTFLFKYQLQTRHVLRINIMAPCC